MANLNHTRAVVAELGGKHLQDHKLVYDTPASIRSSDQRSTSSDDAAQNSTKHTGGRGSGQSASEEASNEDDDEDSSTGQDAPEDEEEDPEAHAPSHGLGKGKGKRPAIRIEPTGEDESHEEEDDETTSHGTGLKPSKHPVNQLLMSDKKRTYSNVSNTSVLFGSDDEQQSFPRRKIARKLSNGGIKPLLKYKETTNAEMTGFENAIESDDEDYSGVNLVPDDDSELEDVEHQEEHFIIGEEEQQATVLINQYNDARRLSLDSCASDNIFDVTAPLDQAYLDGMNLPDLGFGQFFEPEALPSSPDPSAKRKYSDSSTKRVRFDDEVQVSDSSSTSSSELDSSLYPDLFMEQDKLPPSLYQLLENDHDEDNGDMESPTSDLSFWDFGQEEGRSTPLNAPDPFDDDESSDPGSSGYETDMGDTTDEYDSDLDGHPHTPLQKKSVLHRPSSTPGSKASSPKPFQRSSKPPGRAIPPTRGIFIHEDRSKAIAVTNRMTKRLTFYRPRASVVTWISAHGTQSSSTSTANNSPRTSLQQFNGSDSEIGNEVFNNPFSTDVMFAGIFGGDPGGPNDFIFGAQSIGPPEAFYPFVSIGANGAIMDEEEEYDDDDDYEEDLNITDFMDFGSDVDATDVEQDDDETDVPATPATSMLAMNGSTPAQPTPLMETPIGRRRNVSDAMLEHFDRGVVTAFRNNQNRYRDIACLPSDPTIRASVSRPIRSGKSAEALISPARKRSTLRKTSKSSHQASSPLVNSNSPLSGVTKATSRLHSSVMNRRAPRMGTFS